ncbi:expressed unknown protein [Seminavis robusta]|uniref:Uncharacterized protein n=1 Tax=Seminavis robusta TaxID=568900 RepID=A0A9N8DU31_9STRA|nr:expressed unknown protein [Seminavis robusta]|eukprot:Sro276_g105910.1 n/a (985) ;mRNA; r:10351-13470
MALRAPNNSNVPMEVERCLQVVKKILDQNKNPQAAADVDHQYDDKYALVEFVTNTGIAAVLNVLEQLEGFNEEILKQVLAVVLDQKRSMTLRLAVDEDCEFVEETTRQVESPTTHQVSVSSPEAAGATVYSHKTLTEIKEFHWKAGIRHTLTLFAGTDPSMGIVLGTRTGTTRLVTTMKKHPYPPNTRPPLDLDLTFLIRQINPQSMVASFKIDRDNAKTPRRNRQTEEALLFVRDLKSWLAQCLHYFQNVVWQELLGGKTENYAEWLYKIQSTDVFAPVAPLFMEDSAGDNTSNTGHTERAGLVALSAPPAGSPLIPLQDTAKFLQEQTRSLKQALMSLMGNFPDPSDGGQLISGYEAKLVLLFLHLRDIAGQWAVGVKYVEAMLYNQLETAIGKQVKAQDFEEFIKFHNQRLMGKNYAPKPFCYAIRQPNSFPDGMLSILAKRNGGGAAFFAGDDAAGKRDADTIGTFCSHIPGDTLVAPMAIPLNAATTIDFVGDQYLHGWVDTQFNGEQQAEHFISARARQFSCFLLLIGNISGPNEFTPKDAILLQNKDEILIPLLTTALPSAKQFRDAIQSLSPEQARFAKSFRAQQLDSSVFGICVIQVKPQMECLLNLPQNALTKEIQLTTDLLSLFAEYQVPPTLVSYDGADSAALAEKVSAVKEHVKGVLDVIKGIKEEQLHEEARKAAMHKEKLEQERLRAASTRTSASIPFGAPAPAFAGTSFQVRGAAASRARRAAPVAAQARYKMSCAHMSSAAMVTPPPAAQAQRQYEAEDDADSVDFGDGEGFDDLQDQFSDLDIRRGSDGTPKASKEWAVPALDFTAIPKRLDRVFESFDKDGALRTMTLKTGDEWTRVRQENLLTKMKTSKLKAGDKKTESNKALDLLDALSRSGSLPIACGELHVIVGVRHSFEQNVMATVIEENVNPIEKVDYSSLLISSTVHQVDIPTLLTNAVEPPTLVLNNRQFPPLMAGDATNAVTGNQN